MKKAVEIAALRVYALFLSNEDKAKEIADDPDSSVVHFLTYSIVANIAGVSWIAILYFEDSLLNKTLGSLDSTWKGFIFFAFIYVLVRIVLKRIIEGQGGIEAIRYKYIERESREPSFSGIVTLCIFFGAVALGIVLSIAKALSG